MKTSEHKPTDAVAPARSPGGWDPEAQRGLQVLFARVLATTFQALNYKLNLFRPVMLMYHQAFRLWVEGRLRQDPRVVSIASMLLALKIVASVPAVDKMILAYVHVYSVASTGSNSRRTAPRP